MSYIPPQYQIVNVPDSVGGYSPRAMMTSPGYYDPTGYYAALAANNQASLLQNLINKIPQAPSYNPADAVKFYNDTIIAPQVAQAKADVRARGLGGGSPSYDGESSYGGAHVGTVQALGGRQAADYGQQVAAQNYGNAMRGFGTLADLTNQMGQYQSNAAMANADLMGGIAGQQAFGGFNPNNHLYPGFGQRALGALANAIGF